MKQRQYSILKFYLSIKIVAIPGQPANNGRRSSMNPTYTASYIMYYIHTLSEHRIFQVCSNRGKILYNTLQGLSKLTQMHFKVRCLF